MKKIGIGDIVESPPSGPYMGNRISKVIGFTGLKKGIVRIEHIDYPEEILKKELVPCGRLKVKIKNEETEN